MAKQHRCVELHRGEARNATRSASFRIRWARHCVRVPRNQSNFNSLLERAREGESASNVIAAFGFNRTTIYKWLNAALRPGLGIKALRSTKATGRPRSLTPTQESQVFRWVNGRDPRQYGLDFGLWTRAIVVELIETKFGIRLGLTAVGELLAKLG